MNEAIAAALVSIVGIAGVAIVQPRLSAQLHAAKAREDVYLFPPPTELRIATLGYRAAAVDMLWVKLRVEYGMHFVEQRPFPDAPHYLDAILALEPDYAPVFRYVDTMLCYHAPQGTADDARLARKYFERGIAARPNDHEVWLHYGQFIAFMGATFLDSQQEIEQWRVDGAAALQRAVELGDDPDRALAAATLLSQHGARDAAVRALERAYALTDDPATREGLAQRLASLHADDVRDRAAEDVAFIERVWRDRWPFVARGTALLVGPAPDPRACVGERAANATSCALDWGPVLPSANDR